MLYWATLLDKRGKEPDGTDPSFELWKSAIPRYQASINGYTLEDGALPLEATALVKHMRKEKLNNDDVQ